MFKRWFDEYINTNKVEILIIICLLIVGMVIGIVYMIISPETKQVVAKSAKEVLDISKSETYISANIILNGIKADIILIAVLVLFSVMLLGRMIIYLIIALKGMALGVYTMALFSIFGPWWGVVATILLVVIVNLIKIPAFIYLIICLLEVNFNLFKIKLKNSTLLGVSNVISTIIISFILMFSSVMVEQIVSSIVLKIYTQI